MLILMLIYVSELCPCAVNLSDADLCIRIMSLCRKSLIHAVSANDKACKCDSCVKLNKYERKSKQAHMPHAPTLLENSV